MRAAHCMPILAVITIYLTPVTLARADDAANPYAKHLYPMSKAIPCPEVTTDVTEVPELKAWADEAQKVVQTWFPLVTQLLATERYTPPKSIALVFKKDLRVPAYASGGQITINGRWVQAHPDDFGMVVHEMTHLIQRYPGRGGDNKPGWLVEGIADYIRWWRYEPESRRTPINPERASYKDSYRTTAAFLAWAVGKYDRTLVQRLDQALRTSSYSDDLFEKVTGKKLDDLWAEFVSSIRPRASN